MTDPRARADETAAAFGLPPSAACPFCDGDDTELHSAFGSGLSVATYWCRRCHTAFERFKWEGAPALRALNENQDGCPANSSAGAAGAEPSAHAVRAESNAVEPSEAEPSARLRARPQPSTTSSR